MQVSVLISYPDAFETPRSVQPDGEVERCRGRIGNGEARSDSEQYVLG